MKPLNVDHKHCRQADFILIKEHMLKLSIPLLYSTAERLLIFLAGIPHLGTCALQSCPNCRATAAGCQPRNSLCPLNHCRGRQSESCAIFGTLDSQLHDILHRRERFRAAAGEVSSLRIFSLPPAQTSQLSRNCAAVRCFTCSLGLFIQSMSVINSWPEGDSLHEMHAASLCLRADTAAWYGILPGSVCN